MNKKSKMAIKGSEDNIMIQFFFQVQQVEGNNDHNNSKNWQGVLNSPSIQLWESNSSLPLHPWTFKVFFISSGVPQGAPYRYLQISSVSYCLDIITIHISQGLLPGLRGLDCVKAFSKQ